MTPISGVGRRGCAYACRACSHCVEVISGGSRSTRASWHVPQCTCAPRLPGICFGGSMLAVGDEARRPMCLGERLMASTDLSVRRSTRGAMPRIRRPARWEHGAGMALALTGLSAVVAITARAPLSHATPIDARSAATPVTALWLLALGAGIVALSALAVLLWPGRRRRGDDEPEFENETPAMHWLWTLAAIMLALRSRRRAAGGSVRRPEGHGSAVAPRGDRGRRRHR